MRKMLLSLMLIVFVPLSCFSSPGLLTSYSLIEVSWSDTREPVVGATVSATSEILVPGSELSPRQPVAPTDSAGRTYLQVFTQVGGGVGQVEASLEVEVVSNGLESVLSIPNISGSVSEEQSFVITLVSSHASPPPAPRLQVTIGSNPPVIAVDGYARGLQVCDNAHSVVVWAIHSNSNRFYLDAVELYSVPEGFVDSTLHSITGERKSCSAGFHGVELPSFGLSVCAEPFDDSAWTCGDTFCLDSSGAATACEE